MGLGHLPQQQETASLMLLYICGIHPLNIHVRFYFMTGTETLKEDSAPQFSLSCPPLVSRIAWKCLQAVLEK